MWGKVNEDQHNSSQAISINYERWWNEHSRLFTKWNKQRFDLIIESAKLPDPHSEWSKMCQTRSTTMATAYCSRRWPTSSRQEPSWCQPYRTALHRERITRHGRPISRIPYSWSTESQEGSSSRGQLKRSTALAAVNRTGLRLWVNDLSDKYSLIGNFDTLESSHNQHVNSQKLLTFASRIKVLNHAKVLLLVHRKVFWQIRIQTHLYLSM